MDTRIIVRGMLGAASAASLLTVAGVTHAQDAVTMAPPIQGAYDNDAADVPDNASQDTVFNWKEVPENQRVAITRAVFDKGGYQLYDTVGETIVVPFSNDNLYVMKFGISDDGSTYFINDGSEPTLYLPHDGYLENATVAGAKWYPFPQDYHPAEPVFLGIAPSWDDYVDMGWYPDMAFYGGYYCDRPFISGAVVFPTFGLFINIGGHPYYGWAGYHRYYDYHPGFHLTIVDNNFYRWGGRPDYARRAYFDGGHGYGGHSYGSFNHYGGGYGYHDGYGGGDRGFHGGHPTFGNASGGARPFGGGGGYQSYGSHTFRGAQGFGGGHGFSSNGQGLGGGGHNFGGGQGFGNGGHSFGGGNFGGGNRTFGNASGNARPSGGGNSGGDNHSFDGGGNSGGFGGGGRSFGGGGGFGGGHSFGGGGHGR